MSFFPLLKTNENLSFVCCFDQIIYNIYRGILSWPKLPEKNDAQASSEKRKVYLIIEWILYRNRNSNRRCRIHLLNDECFLYNEKPSCNFFFFCHFVQLWTKYQDLFEFSSIRVRWKNLTSWCEGKTSMQIFNKILFILHYILSIILYILRFKVRVQFCSSTGTSPLSFDWNNETRDTERAAHGAINRVKWKT